MTYRPGRRVLWEKPSFHGDPAYFDAQILKVGLDAPSAAPSMLMEALEVLRMAQDWAERVLDCDTLELVGTVQHGEQFAIGYTLYFAATRS